MYNAKSRSKKLNGLGKGNAPRSEVEAFRVMSILRSQCRISLDVTRSVLNISEGTVRPTLK
ncbi:hypothetical protein ACRRTK_017376 [Alexandromys fortis]